MTDVGVDLPAIRARCEAATEGPWSCRHADETDSGSWLIQAGDTSIEASIGDIWEGECDPRPNAEFIAHARSDIPALLALVATLTEERGTMAAHGIDWIHKAEAAESEVERLRGLVADLREAAQAVLAAGERVDELVHHGDDADYTRAVEKRDECEDELRRALAAGEATS